MTPNVNMSFSPSVISFVLHSQKKEISFVLEIVTRVL